MSNQPAASGDLRGQWSLFWWILGTLAIPITIPYLILQFFQAKRPKLSLPGKVSILSLKSIR